MALASAMPGQPVGSFEREGVGPSRSPGDRRPRGRGRSPDDAVNATYRNGVLEGRLPASDDSDRGRAIEIEG